MAFALAMSSSKPRHRADEQTGLRTALNDCGKCLHAERVILARKMRYFLFLLDDRWNMEKGIVSPFWLGYLGGFSLSKGLEKREGQPCLLHIGGMFAN